MAAGPESVPTWPAIFALEAAATDAALSVPGVSRMVPGVRDTATWLVAQLRSRALGAGQVEPSTGGVAVEAEGGRLRVQLNLATDTTRTAARVARQVQTAVAERIAELIGQDVGAVVDEVAVTVLDIDPTGSDA
ncbi:MAG: hypothetical protein ACRDP4_09925 [Nocardioidaceae bacterium]